MADHHAGDGEPDLGREADVLYPDRRATRELFDDLIDRARVRIEWIGPGRLAGALGVLLVVAGIGWWLLRSPALPTEAALPTVTHADAAGNPGGSASTSTEPSRDTVADAAAPAVVVVHVTGAVNRPGVYQLEAGERVDDALAAAGGPTATADSNALNLAAPVADGDRIEVPIVGAADEDDHPAADAGHSHAAPASVAGSAQPVDLNEATAAELEGLPGIGPATASAIVEHRSRNGPFSTIDQLLDVPGIGPAKLDAVRDLVVT